MSRTPISFLVNGQPYSVGEEVRADTPLVDFLRNKAGLTGTKYMCKEGSCGACIVTLSRPHPVSGHPVSMAVNSCLTPLLACHGGSVTTVEGLGNRAAGYSRVQAALARCSGTQCGFCSPGMVMNMHSLLEGKGEVTMQEVENSFGGNTCRCTGYRPILDAFKALSSDSSPDLQRKIADIEDIWKICQNCPRKLEKNGPKHLYIESKNGLPAWYIPRTLDELIKIINHVGSNSYQLVAGNTSQGVFKRKFHPSLLININYISELKGFKLVNKQIELGANVTLTEVLDEFKKLSKQKEYHFLHILADHIQLVANVPVRNVGTLAGNLITKHQHPEFPSDIFVILETVNAKIVLVSYLKREMILSPKEFLETKIEKIVLTKVVIPLLTKEYRLQTFKVMPRAQNVYAYVNAGFLFKLDDNDTVIEKPNIVFGGISSKFDHATETEKYFFNKKLSERKVIEKGLQILSDEVQPIQEGFQASNGFRKILSRNLFYKYIINLLKDVVHPSKKTGGNKLERPLSSGTQSYETKRERWPLNKPIIKTEGIIQCAGEAEYANDIPECFGQLYGNLVLAELAGASITDINPSPALNMEGVVAFFSAKDIPGINNLNVQQPYVTDDEELFCSKEVAFAGQPVGIIVATSEALAEEAASKVIISYKQGRTPVLNTKDILKQNLTSRITHYNTTKPTKDNKNGHAKFELHGEVELGNQFHFTMEPQTCVCIPMEDGLKVYSSTQWTAMIQEAISSVLNIPQNSINLEVRRIGGGFGCKITRSSIVAAACALAAHKLHKPVRVVLDIQTNMKAIGKRNAAYSKYEVGFNNSGLIDWLKVSLYDDMGMNLNDPCCMLVEDGLKNCYDSSQWEMNIYTAVTDVSPSSWMRAPGTVEGMTTIEEIMEHIAFTLKKDPVEVRLINFNKNHAILQKMIPKALSDSNYYAKRHEIQLFNKENRWRKRGISMIPMAFELGYFITLNAMVSIYSPDGTVSLTHGGVEMGQGINTKAIQACAATLGIDVNKIKVKPTSVLTSPNARFSGASITTDCVVLSTIKCCEILNDRLKDIKKSMKDASWEKIIIAANEQDINLNASYVDRLEELSLKSYDVYATAVTEVEVDILTGEYQILRTDILEDAGESLNPEIDIGQIEGAFVMGLGYFLSEKIVIDPVTGMTSSNNTATYWVPGVKDIPIDFRVSLLKEVSNPHGVARSKSTGEPPLCLALSAVHALKNAVLSAREETGLKEWLPLTQPFSVEKICLSSNTTLKHLCI